MSPGWPPKIPHSWPLQNPPPRPPACSWDIENIPFHARSACNPHRQWIEEQIRLGRNAMAIYQDLVENLEISGHMRQKDIFDIIKKQFDDIPHKREFKVEKIIETAQGICNTPADFTSFTEKAIALCSTEYKVLVKLRDLKESTDQEKNEFIKLNFKTILGILDAVKAPPPVKSQHQKRSEKLCKTL